MEGRKNIKEMKGMECRGKYKKTLAWMMHTVPMLGRDGNMEETVELRMLG
jgi:hypothetical protein